MNKHAGHSRTTARAGVVGQLSRTKNTTAIMCVAFGQGNAAELPCLPDRDKTNPTARHKKRKK